MVIGAFQQNGIPEPVPYPQVNTNRGKQIRQHSFTSCMYFYFLHNPFNLKISVPAIKKPRINRGFKYAGTNTVIALQTPIVVYMPPPICCINLFH